MSSAANEEGNEEKTAAPMTPAHSVSSQPARQRADWWAMLIATGLGSGYSPVAPGTAGSLVGLALYWPLERLPDTYQIGALGVLVLVGVAAASQVAHRLGRKDPGLVVVDEVAGMWVSLLFLPLTAATAAAGFFVFRVMDVVKPWPARQLESLPSGWGIMADDLMAGLYANLVLRVALQVWPLA